MRSDGLGIEKLKALGLAVVVGKVRETPQNEMTPFIDAHRMASARSPVLISREITAEAYDMFCVSGILFNDEGSMRL